MIEDQVKEEIKDAAINFGPLLTSWNKWPKSANWKFVGKGGNKKATEVCISCDNC